MVANDNDVVTLKQLRDFDTYVKSFVAQAKQEIQAKIDNLDTKVNNDVVSKFKWQQGTISGTYSSRYGLITFRAPSGTTLDDFNEVAMLGTGSLNGGQSDFPYALPIVIPMNFIKKSMQSGATDTERLYIPINTLNSDVADNNPEYNNHTVYAYVENVTSTSFMLRIYGFSSNYNNGIKYVYFR